MAGTPGEESSVHPGSLCLGGGRMELLGAGKPEAASAPQPRCNFSAMAASIYGEECGVRNREAEGGENGQFLWKLYETCMEYVWNNTVPTP